MTKDVKFKITAVNKTQGAFATVGRSLKGLTKSLFSFKSAIVGAVGIGGLGLLAKKSLEATDRIGKLSNVLGIGVKELQAFKLASEIGGVEFETFAKGVKRLTDNFGDFQQGVGEASKAFQDLGITQADANDLSGDQVAILGLVADRLKLVENDTDKLKIATEIFGGRASDLINVLDGGSEALQGFINESQRFGALNQGQVKAVEALNDSFTRLRTALSNIVNQVVANLSPALTAVVDRFRDILTGTDDAQSGIKEFGLNATKILFSFAVATVEFAEKVVNGFLEIKDKAEDLVDVLKLDFDAIQDSAEKVDFSLIIASLNKFEQQVFASISTNEQFKESFGKTEDEISEGASRMEDAIDGFGAGLTNNLSTTTFDRFREAGQKSFTALSKALSDFVMTGKLNMQTLKEAIIRSLVDALIGEAVSSAIKKAKTIFKMDSIKKALISVYEAGAKALASVPPPFNFAVAGATIAGGMAIVNRIRGFEKGGRPPVGVPSIIGERGAELFVPDQAGTIIPNNQLGGTTNINFTINAVDTRGFRALLRNERGTIVNMINQAVTDKGRMAVI